MEITEHAAKRCKERISIPKRAIGRMVKKALELGKPREEFSGLFRHWLDGVFLNGRAEANNIRVYNGYAFIFADDILITAFAVPPKYRKVATKK